MRETARRTRMRTRPTGPANHGAGAAAGSSAPSGAARAAPASRGRTNGTTLLAPITGAAEVSWASRVTPRSSGAGSPAGAALMRSGVLPVIDGEPIRGRTFELYRDR